MGTHHIVDVTARTGAVDSLDCQVQSRLDFFNYELRQLLLVDWTGVFAIYREALPGNLTPGPDTPRIELAARWMNRDKTTRVIAPREETLLFRADLPGDALWRIEQFRGQGRLFARVEGKFLCLETGAPGAPAVERVKTISSELLDPLRNLWVPLGSEAYELTRDLWSGILKLLRSEDRAILEVIFPSASPRSDAGKRALQRLDAAQAAYNWGPLDDVPRNLYVAIEEIEKSVDGMEAAYGTYVKDRLLQGCKTLKALCNPDRHGDRPESPSGRFDRALAFYVLASTKSLMGVFFSPAIQGPAPLA